MSRKLGDDRDKIVESGVVNWQMVESDELDAAESDDRRPTLPFSVAIC